MTKQPKGDAKNQADKTKQRPTKPTLAARTSPQQVLMGALQRAEFAPDRLTPAEASILQKSLGNRWLGQVIQSPPMTRVPENGRLPLSTPISQHISPGIQREFDLNALKSSKEKSDQETFAQLMALAGTGWEGVKTTALQPLAKLTSSGAELLDLLQTLKVGREQYSLVAQLLQAVGSATGVKELYNTPLRTNLALGLNGLLNLHKLLTATGGNKQTVALAQKLTIPPNEAGVARLVGLINKAGTAVQLDAIYDKVKSLDRLDALFQLTKDGAQLAALLNRVAAEKLQELLENAKATYHKSYYDPANDQALLIDAYENQNVWHRGTFPDAIASAIRHFKKWGAAHGSLKVYTDWCLDTYQQALLLNCKPSTEGDAVTISVKGGRNGNFGPVTAEQLNDMEEEQRTHEGRQKSAAAFFGPLQIFSGW